MKTKEDLIEEYKANFKVHAMQCNNLREDTYKIINFVGDNAQVAVERRLNGKAYVRIKTPTCEQELLEGQYLIKLDLDKDKYNAYVCSAEVFNKLFNKSK